MNNESKKYFRELKLMLPIHDKNEKQLLSDMKSRIEDLNNSVAGITYQQLCDELGAPQEIASEYLANSDTKYLVKKLRFSKFVHIVAVILVVAVIILTCIESYYLHALYQQISAEDATPGYFIETID